MFELFFSVLDFFDNCAWSYVGVPVILIFGLYFSTKSDWFQVTRFGDITRLFWGFLEKRNTKKERGISPLEAFFAAIGGCIGIGNVVSVCSAVQIGGPGAIFWMWVAALLGMLVKYSEIYLGIKYRVQNQTNSYDGGPMYYLKKVDRSGFLSKLFCVFLCIYGVEIYMFRIMTHSIVSTWGWNNSLVIAGLLILILLAGEKGMQGVGRVSGILIPIFIFAYVGISIWTFFQDLSAIPKALSLIFESAFTPHAPIGAFAGSTMMMTISQGMKRACYTGDIGIGYASVIHAESRESIPEKQAALGIFGIFLDTFIVCTLSVLLIVITDLWMLPIHEDIIVATALSKYIPHIKIIWPIFIFLLGYSSLIAFFAVGKKAAAFLSPKYGVQIYLVYAMVAFILFSFVGTEAQILTVMSSTGVSLLLINLYGIFNLRDQISFKLSK